jgi:hypothetical protein
LKIRTQPVQRKDRRKELYIGCGNQIFLCMVCVDNFARLKRLNLNTPKSIFKELLVYDFISFFLKPGNTRRLGLGKKGRSRKNNERTD